MLRAVRARTPTGYPTRTGDAAAALWMQPCRAHVWVAKKSERCYTVTDDARRMGFPKGLAHWPTDITQLWLVG